MTPARIQQLREAREAFEVGHARLRELLIRDLLRANDIPTDTLTALVLLSIAADQFADHAPCSLAELLCGLQTAARDALAEGRLCPNGACRVDLEMMRHPWSHEGHCQWCGAKLGGA
jgi:hypothetical protein